MAIFRHFDGDKGSALMGVNAIMVTHRVLHSVADVHAVLGIEEST